MNDLITAIIKRCTFCTWVLRVIAIGALVRLVIDYNEIPDWSRTPLISIVVIQSISILITSILLSKIKEALLSNDIARAKKISNISWVFLPFGFVVTISMHAALKRYEEVNFSNQQVDPIVTTPVDEVEAQSTQGHP